MIFFYKISAKRILCALGQIFSKVTKGIVKSQTQLGYKIGLVDDCCYDKFWQYLDTLLCICILGGS